MLVSRGSGDSLAESLEPILSPLGAHGPVTFRTTRRPPAQKDGVKNSLFRPHASRREHGRENFLLQAARA